MSTIFPYGMDTSCLLPLLSAQRGAVCGSAPATGTLGRHEIHGKGVRGGPAGVLRQACDEEDGGSDGNRGGEGSHPPSQARRGEASVLALRDGVAIQFLHHSKVHSKVEKSL